MSAGLFGAVFAALFVGHMIGDHLLQTDWQASRKAGRGWPAVAAMGGHLGGYFLAQLAALWAVHVVVVPLDRWAPWWGLGFSVVSHGFIDRRWPVRWLLEHTGSRDFVKMGGVPLNGMYLADQSLHIGCLFVAALIIVGVS